MDLLEKHLSWTYRWGTLRVCKEFVILCYVTIINAFSNQHFAEIQTGPCRRKHVCETANEADNDAFLDVAMRMISDMIKPSTFINITISSNEEIVSDVVPIT